MIKKHEHPSTEMCEVTIELLDPKRLPEVWEFIEVHLQGIADQSRKHLRLQDVTTFIINGSWKLWIIWDAEGMFLALGITEFVKYPGMLACRAVGIAGKGHKKWVHCLAYVERWAANQGCKSMEVLGRPAYRKLLPEYEFTHVILEKSLEKYDA